MLQQIQLILIPRHHNFAVIDYHSDNAKHLNVFRTFQKQLLFLNSLNLTCDLTGHPCRFFQ